MPPAGSSVELIALRPRIVQLQRRQSSQNSELADLRRRSAAVVKRWYERSVLNSSECWTEWEKRLANVEKRVRREEALIARETKDNEIYGSQ